MRACLNSFLITVAHSDNDKFGGLRYEQPVNITVEILNHVPSATCSLASDIIVASTGSKLHISSDLGFGANLGNNKFAE